MPRTNPYPSDLSDAQWALLEPLLQSSERRGRPPKWPVRRVANAVFYLLRSGCAWRMLLREYPPWQTVYYHLPQMAPGRTAAPSPRPRRLRASLREAEGHDWDPSGAVIESQALKGTGVGGPAWGDRNAATTGPSGSAGGSVTCSRGHRRTSARRARPCGKPARP